jgi:hypothetical protein
MQIVDAARALTRDVQVEKRLFEVLGAWSTVETDAELARTFAVLSRHHGEHVLWLTALQPVLHDVVLEPPEIDDLDGPPSAAALVGVLGSLLSGYEQRIGAASETADGPVTRALRLIVTDLRADLSLLAT